MKKIVFCLFFTLFALGFAPHVQAESITSNTQTNMIKRISGEIFYIKYLQISPDETISYPVSRGGVETGARVVSLASSYLGTPYSYGGSSLDGFDCSGFTQFVMNQYGYKLPRTAESQYSAGTYIEKSNLIPGDLVFFGTPINHVGIYAGNNKFIHSSSYSSGGVIYSYLDEGYYLKNYIGAKRIS